MNDVVREVTEYEKLPHLWWLSLDADEFPCGPTGEKVIDYIDKLDNRINCIGANAIDLYPTDLPHYVSGMHPADCQKEGLRRKSVRGIFCNQGHWKHPLLRYDNGIFNMAQSRGSHGPYVKSANIIPLEPHDELVIFHAPLRDKEQTFKRLEALCSKQDSLGGQHRSIADDKAIGGNGAIKRYRCLEYIYNKEWDKVELPHSQIYGNSLTGIALFEWQRLLPALKTFPRWYSTNNKIELPIVV